MVGCGGAVGGGSGGVVGAGVDGTAGITVIVTVPLEGGGATGSGPPGARPG